MSESQRNLLILLAIAIIGVMFSGAFNLGAGILRMLMNLAFTILIIVFLFSLYRRNTGTIARMPLVPRLVLQGAALLLCAIVITGTFQIGGLLPYPPFGWAGKYPVAFYGSVFALGFAIWWAWQQRNSGN